MSSNVSTSNDSTSSERFTGRVKWFNNKAGYGFITVTDGPKSGSDVFVHHSTIKVDHEQYKYLVQGEYVDFILSVSDQGHEFQAGEVCGIKGGKLMCETRRDSRTARSQYRSSRPEQTDTVESVKMPRSVSVPREQKSTRHPRTRGEGPREEGGEWTYVAKARTASEATTSQTQRASGGRGRGRPPKTGLGEGNTKSS